MLKIMIVDDEFYFREALKISLPWAELGFEICGEAKNGRDALEKVGALSPHIIIVDINMPIMDGLEFVQNIKERNINSKIIILTGHSEFNYAKQAVQMGVHNYILKPVNEEELTKTLLDIKNVIEKETDIKIEIDSLKRQVKDSMPMLKDKFLNELLQGRIIGRGKELLKKMEYLNINIYSEYYLVVTIELDYEENPDWNQEDKQLWNFAVSNISNEILEEQFVFDICSDIEDRICIIIGRNSMEDYNYFNFHLENSLELVRTAIHNHLSFTITIGVGSEKNELFDISSSYKESIIALKNKIAVGKNKIILYGSVEDSGIKGNLFTGEHRSQLLLNMRIVDEKEVQKLIKQIFMNMRGENIHHEILFVVCIEIVAVCLEFIVEVGLSFKDVLPNGHFNIIEEIQSKKSIDEMESWIKEIFKHTMGIIKKNKSSKASKLIEEVKKYINDNYHNDELSVDEIAKSLFVNYAHLCFVFKRDTGATINEYLTEFRIKKAKELFDIGNTLILDVARRVGYADANYFGKCFKKHYGLAPSKYIDNIS
ncbi:AraC family two component transcriptional regulator [Anaerobacterium chartisolvens]|uniref:Stage 0 sporulation protein A homolog n=1 Tax=Anaerobacterium chartisolvens TaxID=1297424 RepID=A0A369AEX4_9FIRM|nr:response regulator [Anaerobacterium chartisolvens]RCX07869.1 AraC family two component transcriptional regulator [Anaerobacterium chartisolvens]